MVTRSTRGDDKRVERSKAKLLAETYRQLVKNGIGGVSIDEIARITGISKTTIYRHWPSRSALLIDACSRLGSVPELPDTGSLKGDVRVLLTQLADQLQTANWSSVYPSILDAAERDREVATLQAALHRAFMTPFEEVVQRAKAKGEISRLSFSGDWVAVLVGPFFYCRWFSKQKIDKGFINRVIDLVIREG